MRTCTLFLVPCLLLCISLFGQSSAISSTAPSMQPLIVRDEEAVNVVQKAITALGGTEAINQVQSLQVQAQGQSVMPRGEKATGMVTWEMAGSELRIASVSNLGSSTVVTGYGKPGVSALGANADLPPHIMAAIFVPALIAPTLVKIFHNPACELGYIGPKTLTQKPVTAVRTQCFDVRDPIVTAQTWFFDVSTFLPVRVEFRVPSMKFPQLGVFGAVELSDYRQYSAVFYPFQIVTYRQGKQTGTLNVQTVNVNASIPASDFDLPTAGAQ